MRGQPSSPIGRRRRFRRDQHGFALPTVLFMVLAGFAVASVGAVAGIRAQQGTARDYDTKDALAVAEAGVHEALLRYNAAAANQACVPPQQLSGQWCTPATGELSGGGQFSYWVSPASGQIEVVSQGSADGVTRRVDVTAHSAAGAQPFFDAGVVGLNAIGLDANATAAANVATNGDVTLLSNSELCGHAQVGVGRDVLPPGTSGHICGTEVEGTVTLPPLNQGDVVTNNANSGFFATDVVSGNRADVCWGGFNANGTPDNHCGSREMVLQHNSAVTLAGGNYSFCKLVLQQNTALYIASGVTVRIYFDSPEACGYDSGTSQLELSSNSRITANGSGGAVDVALLFVGSESRATSITLNSNTVAQAFCDQDFVVYAPRTDVILDSNSYYCGAIGGKTIHVNSNAHIRTSNQAQEFVLPNSPPHYVVDDFIECSGPAGAVPDTGC